ncbi:MAG: YidC/Oxa1 family membrane protein insertase [Halieaceae bacterium]|jgi:YidC/Oxa1 family membrane protein insertase
MDIQRTLLIGAIMLLSFMLLTEWVNFKETKNAPVVTETRLTATAARGASALNSAASSAEAPVLPASTVGAPAMNSESDIPALPETDESSAASPLDPTTTAEGVDEQRIIRIYTDTLQMAIDLQGGDIIEVALPEFLARIDDPDVPFVLLESNPQRVYIAQSGLIGRDGIDSKGRANYSSQQREYRIGNAPSLEVDLNWSDGAGITVTKRFTFQRDGYVISVDHIIDNQSQARWQGNVFGQIKRDGSPAPQSDSSGMGMQPFLGAATTTPDDRFKKFSFDNIAKEPFRELLPGGWIAMIQHYFVSAWIPDPETTSTFSTRVTSNDFYIAGFTSPAIAVDPGSTVTANTRFYAGPKDQSSLKEISPYLELSVDYGWLWWICQSLFWLLTKIHSLVGNWGLAIILLTVTVKAAFFKLSATSYRSMANMRRVQPQLQDIREQHAGDKQKQSQAMMEMYRKEKINPMGGCLPIVVQMPVFIALYWVLMESVELRHAPFMLWIHDLSVMDPYFVLPLMMGASMWFMQKLNPPPPDPMQAKIMQWLPVIFTFFFLWFPAGLVLYWVVNNLLSMSQQYIITRQIEKTAS